ncbi:helix-turn-helix transcriptional regulator [Pseudomaricurvus alkylphenolicus]|jgi:DNA-binding CsgD family transcriptional regulator|uniref:helix-turn-helix transcriptional regulator n=1 Tax=Pseudomaricurvus alkylphenolicus TaxID=1306991 RepID=UPI001421E2A6|nr:helix-turn-helix transcriptional regulator [Pseudomaricurvus alkylphenolicus]NIB43649.1 helix-turn-helix transcriptional regulator [Pseudomaricurvus alkylphenolicus]
MFKSKYKSTDFPHRFQEESLALVNGLLPLTSSAFYLVDPNMHHKGIVLHGIEQEMDQAYRLHYKDLDPAHPARYQKRKENLVCLENIMSTSTLHNTVYYQEFLKPRNIEHVTDLFFRQEDRIIAVLTMLRDASLPAFSPEELQTLTVTQRFLEYAINTVYLPERASQRATITDRFELTDRELDVLEWVIAGAENKVIARELEVGLATVKTHLNHIYAKVGVSSRTQLLSRVFAEIGH